MKNLKKHYLLLILIVAVSASISSCQIFNKTILRITGDYKKPQYEEIAGIIEYCDNAGVNYDEIWMAKNEDYRRILNEDYIHFIPQVFIFDKNKSNLTIEEGKDCVGSIMYFLNDTIIKPINTHDTLLYSNILEKCTVIKDAQINSNPDYYYIISWAKYFPKMTDDVFKKVNDLRKIGKINAKYILLNMDFPKQTEKTEKIK